MSDSIDTYIDTMTNDADSATEFKELFECFVHDGPWVALSEYRELQAENERLRELVRDMLTEMVDYDLIGCCRYVKKARELGIEVDE